MGLFLILTFIIEILFDLEEIDMFPLQELLNLCIILFKAKDVL